MIVVVVIVVAEVIVAASREATEKRKRKEEEESLSEENYCSSSSWLRLLSVVLFVWFSFCFPCVAAPQTVRPRLGGTTLLLAAGVVVMSP